MKKLLALVLALVMSMSLVTISNADFNDADKISNDEAVAVMSAVGVLAGYDNGDFGPTDTLTRAQACKIVAYLDLGGKTADAIKGSGTVFSDVPANQWYAGYVEYCAGAGYVSGVGGGKFDPNANVTGVQFAKMLLCALGYKADVEGYNGTDWSLAIARDANKNELFEDLSIVTSAPLTREQAAQMAFNALKATVVEYKGGTNVSTSDGTKVTVNAERDEVTANSDYRDNSDADGKQQLAEKLYGGSKGLKYVTTSLGVDADDFGRPAEYKWTYDGEDVYVSHVKADFVYTAKTSASDMLKDLKGYKIGNTKITEKSQLTTYASKTANGKLVEFYFDDDNKFDTNVGTSGVIEITYTLSQVTSIKTNKDGDVTYKFDGFADNYKTFADEDKDDEVVLAGKVAEDDYVTVYKTAGNILYVYPTTSFTGAQSAYNNADLYLMINGSKYEVGTGVKVDNSNYVAMSHFANSDKSSNTYYVDQYGFVVKTTAASASTDYAYVVDVYAKVNTSIDAKTPYVEVRAVLADGTVGVYKVAVEKTSGTWYLKDSAVEIDPTNNNFVTDWENYFKGNVFGYTLDGDTMTVESISTTLAEDSTTALKAKGTGGVNYYINEDDTSVKDKDDKVVLLDKDVTIVVYDDDDKVAKVYTGTGDLGSTEIVNFVTVVSSEGSSVGTADIVYATVTGGLAADVSDYVYVTASDVTTTLVDGKTKYNYQGLTPDGSEITLVSSNAFDTNGLYKFAEDYSTEKANLISADSRFLNGSLAVTGKLVQVGGSSDYYNMADAQIVYVDDDKSEVDGNTGWVVLVKENGSVTKNVETIYVW